MHSHLESTPHAFIFRMISGHVLNGENGQSAHGILVQICVERNENEMSKEHEIHGKSIFKAMAWK